MKYLDPVGNARSAESGPAKRAATVPALAGVTLGIINNGWDSMRRIGERIAELAVQRHAVGSVRFYAVPRNKAPEAGVLQRVLDECDAAIVGLAN